jgi:hypothetical protein
MLCENHDRCRHFTHADRNVLDPAAFHSSYVKRRKDFRRWEGFRISDAVEKPSRVFWVRFEGEELSESGWRAAFCVFTCICRMMGLRGDVGL